MNQVGAARAVVLHGSDCVRHFGKAEACVDYKIVEHKPEPEHPPAGSSARVTSLILCPSASRNILIDYING